MSNTEDIRKIMDRLKDSEQKTVEASKKPDNMLTEDFNDNMDAPGPTTKVEIEFNGPEDAEVEVYATGMDEIKRLVDLAGIFHKEKAGGMGIDVDPMGAIDIPAGPVGMDAPMGMDEPMGMEPPMGDEPMGMDDPMGDEPMGMDDPMAEPVDAEPMGDMGMDMPSGGPDVPVDGDIVAVDGPGTMDDAPEVDFSMEPEVEGLGESGLRYDYGNPGENMGQEKFHMDAYNFAGGASKPVRAIPARSGDNPMIDPATKKGLKEYMSELVEELEKKNLNEFDLKKKGGALTQAIGAELSSTQARGFSDAMDELGDDPQGTAKTKALTTQGAADLVAGKMDQPLSGPEQREIEDRLQDLEDEGDELMDSSRNWSFKQKVLPFQGLTGTQRLHRNALRRVRQTFKK